MTLGSAFAALFAIALLPLAVDAQTASPPPAGTFEDITIGEPMVDLRQAFGDPIRVFSSGDSTIWRYLTHEGSAYTDVIVKNNVAQSVTLLSRTDGAAYTDPRGVAFGMSADQVIAKLGAPARRSTNADDQSLDLWYYALPYGWIYEFHRDRLDFIQLVAAPELIKTLAAGPPAEPNDGTSFERAIWIRPPNLPNWIDVFLAENTCGNEGHWSGTSTKHAAESAKSDPAAYTIVHASCTDGGAQRDFYFDTRGASPSPSPSPNP